MIRFVPHVDPSIILHQVVLGLSNLPSTLLEISEQTKTNFCKVASPLWRSSAIKQQESTRWNKRHTPSQIFASIAAQDYMSPYILNKSYWLNFVFSFFKRKICSLISRHSRNLTPAKDSCYISIRQSSFTRLSSAVSLSLLLEISEQTKMNFCKDASPLGYSSAISSKTTFYKALGETKGIHEARNEGHYIACVQPPLPLTLHKAKL